MKDELLVEGVMTPFPHSVGVDQPVRAALEMMHEYGIRHLPVQKGGQLVGVLSEGDINFALRVDKTSDENLKVADVYTDEPYSVQANVPVRQIAAHMARSAIGCTLVMDRAKLIGIFTTVDACRVLGEVLMKNEHSQ